jgi:UDP-glucose 4-epimerase
MKILITGGAGYIGTALCDALDADPTIDRITVYDALIRGDHRFLFRSMPYQKVHFLRGDILDTERLQSACAGHDVVIHLAAFVDEPFHHTQHLQYDQTNGFGSLSVVRAVEHLPEIKRVLYLSSSAVYGFRDNIAPNDAPAPENGYGQSKWLGERYFERLRSAGKELHILRSAQVFGPNRTMRLDTVVHAFLFAALTDGRVDVFGDGQQHRAFVHLSQMVAELHKRATGKHPESAQEPALLATFQTTVSELLDWLRAQIPTTEYRYLTPNMRLPGQTFATLPHLNASLLTETMTDFQAMLSTPPHPSIL